MAFKPRYDKIPQDDNLVVGLTTLRLKSSLKSAEQPYKRELFEREGGRCNGCQEEYEFRDLTVDHVIPVAVGGGWYQIDNLQLLCRRCNQLKGKGAQEDLMVRLRRNGERRE